jgi:hypothetical protein
MARYKITIELAVEFDSGVTANGRQSLVDELGQELAEVVSDYDNIVRCEHLASEVAKYDE